MEQLNGRTDYQCLLLAAIKLYFNNKYHFFTSRIQMLNSFSKSKVVYLKAILPFIIIFHHLSHRGIGLLSSFDTIDQFILSFFFAMSGYGLVVSFKHRENYLNNFLSHSLLKLYIPYFICLIYFTLYRVFVGINLVDVFHEKGICGLVPASWYIFVLSLFYVFFYLAFRFFEKRQLIVRILIVCLLVFLYYVIAINTGVSYWRYMRCPAFCVGLLFAYYDLPIRTKMGKLGAILLACVMSFLCMFSMYLLPIFASAAFFLIMYCLPDFPQNKIIVFFNNISLEMYIVQYLPFYYIMDYCQISNPLGIILLVLLLDVGIALLTNKVSSSIQSLIVKPRAVKVVS